MAALLFAIAALITHCVARSLLAESMHQKAERISQAAKQHTPYVADPLAVQASHAWNLLTVTGVMLTVSSVGCMVTARIRRERGWYLILLLVMVFDIGMPMIL